MFLAYLALGADNEAGGDGPGADEAATSPPESGDEQEEAARAAELQRQAAEEGRREARRLQEEADAQLKRQMPKFRSANLKCRA